MPDDVHRHAEESPHPHGPTHPEVRYERKDARIHYAVWFAGILVAGAVTIHAVLWVLLGGMERRQAAGEEERGMRPPPIAQTDRPHFPAALKDLKAPPLQVGDVEDMTVQRQREDAYLASYGWQDRAGGVVHIPIEQALKLLADPAAAKAHGITARPEKETK